MLLLSERAGRLAGRIGPRLPLGIGPLVMALGLVLLGRAGSAYVTTVLPAILVLGLGLATTVAPLTTAVLAAAPTEKAGIASAVNNCVARTGGLLAVALLPAVAGAGPERGLGDPAVFARGLHIAAGLCVAGALLALVGIRSLPRAGAAAGGAAQP
jgi:hypothetical protein